MMQNEMLISDQAIRLVKSTAPLLAEKGEELTRYFYRRMFEYNPEVKPLFNTSNQDGTQQRALAAAITAYAAHIDDMGALLDTVELIAQKHASLQVKPHHYPIVGENLLAAISHVLGVDPAGEVVNAWGDAYNILANLLMGRESTIYQQNADKIGGWQGFKSFSVIRKEEESTQVTSFYLVPYDDAALPEFYPGQYITVRVPTENGSTTMRNYSLSDEPGHNWLRISVKKEEAQSAEGQPGYVSNYLHNQLCVGDKLEVAPPCGEFVLDINQQGDRPLVYLAGGIGITPVLSMVKSALKAMPNQKISLIYAATSHQALAFFDEIEALRKRYSNFSVHYRYSAETTDTLAGRSDCSLGYVTDALLEQQLTDFNADYYFCGPKPFMVQVYALLLNRAVPRERIRFEFFGPREDIEKVEKAYAKVEDVA